MPVRGWYPDPGGVPGLFRYFDGQTWTHQTTRDPQQPLPSAIGSKPRTGRLLMAVVGMLILVVITGIAIWQTRQDQVVSDPPGPTSTLSGWDDSSPLPSESPTPSASSSPETAGPSPRDTASAQSVACDLSHRSELGDQPQNGRVRGGPLSFTAISHWTDPHPTRRFFFSRDSYVQTLTLPEELPWAASAQVGVLEMDDDITTAKATQQLLQCLITSDFYTSVDVTVKKNDTKKINVGSTEASQLDVLLTFHHRQLKTTGSKVRIIAVDSSPRTYYFHAVPHERTDLIKLTDAATASLSVE